MTDVLLRRRDVAARIGCSVSRLQQIRQDARFAFPAPVVYGSAVRFSEAEVGQWIEAQKQKRPVPLSA